MHTSSLSPAVTLKIRRILTRFAWMQIYLKSGNRFMRYRVNKRKSHADADPKEYSSVFRENRCPLTPKPVYGGNFSHEAVILKIRSRSPKSNKLFIMSDLYRLENLVTFHPMVHEITCRQTLFGLILVD